MMTSAEKQRRYRERHWHDLTFRARVRAAKRLSYQRNKSNCLARSQRWADAHRDRVKAISRAHYANHLEEQRERSRNKPPEVTRATWHRYHRRHHERYVQMKVAAEMQRRAQKYATVSEPIDYGTVIASARGLCGICHEPIGTARTHFDHIVPLARGGPHAQTNLRLAHATCNIRKGARSPMAA